MNRIVFLLLFYTFLPCLKLDAQETFIKRPVDLNFKGASSVYASGDMASEIITWNGKIDSGKVSDKGLYLCVLRTDDRRTISSRIIRTQ